MPRLIAPHTANSTSDNAFPILDRVPSSYNPLSTFILPKGEDRHYTQQFADMYFARLARVKPAVEQIAEEAWEGFEVCNPRICTEGSQGTAWDGMADHCDTSR